MLFRTLAPAKCIRSRRLGRYLQPATFIGIFQPMLDCTKKKSPCSVKPVPDPPPCPPKPPPPFPWIYVWIAAGFIGSIGIFYRLYRLKEAREKADNKPQWHPRQKRKRPFSDDDLPVCAQYLIIGTGAAGWAAYKAIVEHDKKAKVLFITREDIIPYRRPPMSKWMWWNKEPPDLKNLFYITEEGKRNSMYYSECKDFVDPVTFHRMKTGPAVSLCSGYCVLRIDPDEHVAYVRTMCGEKPIYYERCLLAPGAQPKNIPVFKNAPKAVRKKMTTLRTIRDLEIAFRKVREAKHVTIIGGGFLGCELAWYLGRMNKVVPREDADGEPDPIEFAHIIKEKGILSSIIPEYLGEWAAEKIRCENVKVIPQTLVYDAFVTKDNRLELTLSDGSSLVTDYVIVAVGAKPRLELAESSFLELDEVNGGVKVNTELESRTHLFVAGDAASFFSQWRETRLRFEHYDNAEEQGYIAGGNMTGYWTPCNMEPHYDLELGRALKVHVIGEVGACMPVIALFKNCKDEPMTKAQKEAEGEVENATCLKQPEDYKSRYKRGLLFYLRDETIVGMIFWNIPPMEGYVDVITELLRAKPSYEEISMLADMLGFSDAECVYLTEEEIQQASQECTVKNLKTW